MSEIELHLGTDFCSSDELNRIARQQELSVVIAKAKIFDEICRAVPLSDELEAGLIQAFLQREQLKNDTEIESYLHARGWREADLIYIATKAERLRRFQENVFQQEVELNYIGQKIDLDQVNYSLISVTDADHAFELHQRLQEGEDDIQNLIQIVPDPPCEGLKSGNYGPQTISDSHPSLINRLRVGEAGQIWPPFFSEGLWIVLRLNHRREAPLTDEIYADLLDQAFEGWLNRRISQLLTGQQPPELPHNLLSSGTKERTDIPSKTDSIDAHIEFIQLQLESQNLDTACQQANKLLQEHGSNADALNIAYQAHHLANRHEQALAIAIQLTDHHPSKIEGYGRAGQELLLLEQPSEASTWIRQGLAMEAENPWLLMLGLKAAVNSSNFDEAETFGQTMHSTRPDIPDLYEPYLRALLHNKREQLAARVAQQALELFPGNNEITQTAIQVLKRTQHLEECRWGLYKAIQNVKTRSQAKQLCEELYHLESQRLQRDDSHNRQEGCDILCIASNDAAYIHEFIHHHINLGFRKIFIGVHNCQDKTISILEKIKHNYQQVHVTHIDHVIQPFQQWGAYHKLFETAIKTSTSQYCFVLDINEFWVSDCFPQSIDQFVNEAPDFDAYCFHWTEAFEKKAFDHPLATTSQYEFSPWVKTLFKYDAILSRIGIHGPIFNADPDDITVILGNQINSNLLDSLNGTEVLGFTSDSLISTAQTDQKAWIIRRSHRSELEYCSELLQFQPQPSKGLAQNWLGSDHHGWRTTPHSDKDMTHVMHSFLNTERAQDYAASLNAFISACNISEELDAARNECTVERIMEAINVIPTHVINNNSEKITEAFQGTRFTEQIEQRLQGTT